MDDFTIEDVFMAHGASDVSMPEEDEKPSKFQAVMETENSIYSANALLQDLPYGFDVVDDEFDSLGAANSIEDITEAQRIDLTRSRNPDEFSWKYQNLQREKANREVISEMGMTGSLSLGLLAGITDPVAWAMAPIPLVRSATFLGRAAKAAPIGMADLAFSEVVLSSTQTERTFEESRNNVIAGAVFGGILGGALGRSDVMKDFSKISDEAYVADGSGRFYTATHEAGIPAGAVPNPDDSVGAAKTRTYNSIVTKYAPGYQDEMYDALYKGEITGAEFASKIATKASEAQEVVGGPVTRLVSRLTMATDVAHSRNWRAVALGDRMMESSILKRFHIKGVGSQAARDTEIESRVGMEVVGRVEVGNKYYSEMVGSKSAIKQTIGGMTGKHMTIEDFNKAIYDAYDNFGKHENEFVEKAASELRQMDEAYEKAMVDAGVLAPGNFEDGQRLFAREAKINKEMRDLETQADALTIKNAKLADEIADLEKKVADVKAAGKSNKVLTDRLAVKKNKFTNSQSRLKSNKERSVINDEERTKLMDELDSFKYDPTHGNPIGGGWYVPRVFKTDAVFMNKPEFVKRTTDDLIDQMKQATRNPELSPEELAKAKADYDNALKNREDLEADMEKTWQKITHSHTGFSAATLSGAGRFKAQRKLSVRNEALKGKDGEVNFLENDYFAVKKAQIRAMTPELTARESGFNFTEELNAVNEEYERLIKEVGSGTRKGHQLRREQTRLTTKLEAANEIQNNRYGHPADPFGPANRMRSAIMNWNVMRALGSMTISAIPDLGNIVTRLGLTAVSKNMASMAMHPGKYKMGREAAKRLSLVTERVMASRMNQIALTGNMAPGVGAAEKGLHKASNYFITATGMNHWNQGLKEFVIVAYSDDLMRVAKKFASNPESMSKAKRAKFASAGIDSEDFIKMADQHRRFGDNEGGLEIPNFDRWDDTALQYKVMMALKKEADTAVVTPGSGDLPLWMRGHVGGMMGQFKSFGFAATNKILIPGVQRMALGDPNAVAGMTLQMALGSAVYGLKMQMYGKEPKTDWPTLVRESIDRSGYFGIYSDANAMIEKMSRGNLGIAGIYKQFGIENPELSRYYTRPILGDILGPTAGTVEDMGRMIGSVFSGEITSGDISAWRRMVPYQNMWYLRNGLNEIQDAANERFVE